MNSSVDLSDMHQLGNALWLHACAYRLRLERSLQNEMRYPSNQDLSEEKLVDLRTRILACEETMQAILKTIGTG